MKLSVLGLIVLSIISFSKTKVSEHPTHAMKNPGDMPSISASVNFMAMEPPQLWPVSNIQKVSSGFGMRIHPIEKIEKFHRGIDIPAPSGTLVRATASGTVAETGYNKFDGNYIVIDHDEIYSSKYSQLLEMTVQKGSIVKKGETIGSVGSSGRSTAPHLHFEVKESGTHVDPLKFVKA